MNKYKLSEYIAGKYSGEITHMKLQKLLYYCYAWQLVAGKKEFEANFEAWNLGPVEPDIYKKFKKYGKSLITSEPCSVENQSFFDFVLDSYAVFSAIELSKTTHHETPWKKYKNSGEVIPDEELLSYYGQHPFAKNFPLNGNNTYYPPKTSSHYSFTFDMEKEYVPIFNSLSEYVNSFKEAEEILNGVLHSYGIK
ncbi:MAG: DUF4065 domain-containing protein [Bacteroidetes bacterium]|jgi:uncharacterized phage-associated protein|nr:DUF4065 domain-containing protein [Bacteroidota bacterium]